MEKEKYASAENIPQKEKIETHFRLEEKLFLHLQQQISSAWEPSGLINLTKVSQAHGWRP
jgi:hypothetical protein